MRTTVSTPEGAAGIVRLVLSALFVIATLLGALIIRPTDAAATTVYFGGCIAAEVPTGPSEFNVTCTPTSIAGSLTYQESATPFPHVPPVGIDGTYQTYYLADQLLAKSSTSAIQTLPGAQIRFCSTCSEGFIHVASGHSTSTGLNSFQLDIQSPATSLPDLTISLSSPLFATSATDGGLGIPAHSVSLLSASTSFASIFVDGPNSISSAPGSYTYTHGAVSITLSAAGNDGMFTAIDAAFKPNFGLSLADAALIGEFKGFDWQQWVVRDPVDIHAADGTPLSVPFLDPPKGGYQEYKLRCPQLGGLLNYVSQADPNPFYYDASGSNGTGPSGDCFSLSSHKSDDTLSFEDMPFAKDLPAGEFLQFDTCLVGIQQDGTPSPCLYDWKWSDTFNGNDAGGINVLSYSNLLPLDLNSGYGGITMITDFSNDVPEPSSIYLLIFSCIGMLWLTRKSLPRF